MSAWMDLSHVYGNLFLPPGAEVHLPSIMQNIFSSLFNIKLDFCPPSTSPSSSLWHIQIIKSEWVSYLVVDGEDEVKEKSEKKGNEKLFWFVFLFMQKKLNSNLPLERKNKREKGFKIYYGVPMTGAKMRFSVSAIRQQCASLTLWIMKYKVARIFSSSFCFTYVRCYAFFCVCSAIKRKPDKI